MGHTPDASDRIWFLHVLRAVAVLAVVYSHVVTGPWASADIHSHYANVPPPDLSSFDGKWDNPMIVPYMYGPLSWLYRNHVDSGSAGVGLFFLISGVLIPLALERRRATGFLITRFFRIYPVWVASLAIAALWFLLYAAATGATFPPYGATDWLANAGLITDWFPWHAAINPVAWTLLIEWKFYFLCAALAALGLLHRPPYILGLVVLIGGLGIAGNLYLVHRPYAGEFLQVLANMARDAGPFLCVTFVGVCFYHHLVGTWSTRTCTSVVAALSLLMVVAFRLGSASAEAGTVRLHSFTAAGALFLAAYVMRSRIPYSRFLNWIADISYPLYAVHYLVGVGVMFTVYAMLPIAVIAQLASVSVSLLVAAALHRWVERPANDFGKALSPAEPHVALDDPQALPSPGVS